MRGRSGISHNHQKPTTKMPLFLNRIILGTDYTQPQFHLCFLHKSTTSTNPSNSRVTWGMSSLGRRERNRVRRIQSPKPKPKSKPFHCEHCGRDGHLAEFCFRRKRGERLSRELANKDRYRPSRGVPKPRLVSRGEGMVRTIYPRERREFVPLGEPPHREGGRHVGLGRGEFAGRSFARGQYEYGGNDHSFRSQRSYRPWSPLRGTRSIPRGRVGVPPRIDRMNFANPTFEQMVRHWFDSFCTNPTNESFAHSHSRF
jgi:hypothetical protein